MKKWQAWLLIIGTVLVVFVLVERGVIRWQPLTILVAAILGPLKFLSGLFGSKEDEIRERHREVRAREAVFQAQQEQEVQVHEERIDGLQGEVERIDEDLDRLARRRAELAGEIAGASDEELLERGRRAFG